MHMTENLSASQAKWLTYLVWILITLLTGTTAFQFKLISEQNEKLIAVETRVTSYHLPEKYVTLERYSSDMARMCTVVDKMDANMEIKFNNLSAKLDRLIEKFTTVRER